MPKKLDYHEKHKNDWRWQEGDVTATRTTMWTGPGCHNGCGVIYYTKDNKVVGIEGDVNNPVNQGRLCMRCLNYVESVKHPERLKWPLKRVGERGENKWERISWDAAYDIIVAKVRHIQKNYGPESIVAMEGTGRNIVWQVNYLCYAGFRSPNFTLGFLSGDSCYMPRAAVEAVTNGDFFLVDCSQQFEDRYDTPEWKAPEVIMIWGSNPLVANADGFFGHWIVDLMKRGSKLIVVDPKLTWLAAKADYWLRIRPGSDAALAMAFLNIVIQEGLIDKDFVEKWTNGFAELAERVKDWTPERAVSICWVDKDTLLNAARMFGKANGAAIHWGVAVDMSVPGVATAQCLNSLVAITGNMDVPGGNILVQYAYGQGLAYNYGYETLPPELQEKRLGNEYPLRQTGFGANAHEDAVLEAIESGKPYPIKMLWLQSTNPIANMAGEAPRVYQAMKSVDFNVVVDLYMTPTAVACADLVLPCAMSSERWGNRNWYTPLRTITKVAEYEEAKSDEDIILELGKRLNPELFPWTDNKDWYDWIMLNEATECGLTFDELQEKVYSFPKFEYRKYEKGLLRPDGEPGFNTYTGKLELKIELYEQWGLDPLPWYAEPPESPYSTPELFEEYPFVMTCGNRSYEFFHSEHRQLKLNREFHPDPIMDINTEAAARLGIREGDWVWIENRRGRFQQRARLDSYLDPRVIRAEHGWWFPEKEAAEPSLFGVFDSNCNNLTTMCINGPTGYGAPYKCQIAKVYKVTEENSKIMPTEQVTRLGGFGYVKK